MTRIQLLLVAALLVPLSAFSQQHFPKEIPAGNYSGVCPIGNDRYAVVSDKSAEDGFFVFHITFDTLRHRISSIRNEGFRSAHRPGSDLEAICYCPETETLWLASEQNSDVWECRLDGTPTNRRLQMPASFKKASKNYGLESLTYDSSTHQFLTTTERPLRGDSVHRIQGFGTDGKPTRQYYYKADGPINSKYMWGVVELCATGDGRVLVMERQAMIPKRKIGAKTRIRIYEVTLGQQQRLNKRLVHEFKTRLTVTSRSFGNYEGLCEWHPGYLLLMADSQNQYAGVLHDWFKVVSY